MNLVSYIRSINELIGNLISTLLPSIVGILDEKYLCSGNIRNQYAILGLRSLRNWPDKIDIIAELDIK